MQVAAREHLAKCTTAVLASALLAMAAVGLALCWACPAHGASLVRTLVFSPDDLSFSRQGNYDVVSLAGARWLNQSGAPRLPLVSVRVALPPDAAGLTVSVAGADSIVLPGTYLVVPAQPPQPLSARTRVAFVGPVAAVYGSSGGFPRQPVEVAGAGKIAGQNICDLLVHPMRYEPSAGRLTLYTELVVRLEFDCSGEPGGSRGLTGLAASAEARSLAARLTSGAPAAVGATQADFWGKTSRLVGDHVPQGEGEVNYVIITSEALKASFEPLRQWKMRKGLVSEIVTVETIAAYYPGADLQEKIRSCIRYFRAERGTDWVLLGGDVQVVPVRKAYVPLSDKPDIPCDLYYADLDGTWNADGDLYWGETPSDGVDMYADVFLGRAPVATTAEADIFVDKVLTYEGLRPLPLDYQLRMAFLGEILWGDPVYPSDPDYTDAGTAKNLIDSRYVPSRFGIEKLYERSGTLHYATAMSALDQGKGFVNVACHGLYKSISVADDYVSGDDLLMLTTDGRYGLMYSTSCNSGGFDQSDCAGESWVLAPRGGGFYIGNSRYGWGTPGHPGEGPSDLYDQAFFASVFVTGFTNLGKAHADAKHEYVGECRGDPYIRYLMYGLNLLGDPEMPLWTNTPRNLAVTARSAIDTSPQVYSIGVRLDGASLAGAKVCLWKDGEIFAVDETDLSGNAAFVVDAVTPGRMFVTVTARNAVPYAGEAIVTASPPHPASPASLAAAEGPGPVVGLVWAAVADSDLASYRIWRNTFTTPVFYRTVAASDTMCEDASVVIGATYYYWVTGLDSLGNESGYSAMAAVHVEGDVGVPRGPADGRPVTTVSPNPFLWSVRLGLSAPGATSASAAIFDVDGRRVAVAQLKPTAQGGLEAVWAGDDANGRRVSSGIYFVKFVSGSFAETRKVILLD